MAAAPPAPRRVEYMRLSEIPFASRNPKGHDIEGIGGSIDLHGMGELPLLDERTGRLVAGHGRIVALQERQARGGTPPDGLLLSEDGEWLAPVVRGWRSSSDAGADSYLIGSNEWVTAGGWDDESALLEMITQLQETDAELLAAAGHDDGSVEELRRAVAAAEDPTTATVVAPEEFPSYDQSIATAFQCPKCSYEWAGKPR